MQSASTVEPLAGVAADRWSDIADVGGLLQVVARGTGRFALQRE